MGTISVATDKQREARLQQLEMEDKAKQQQEEKAKKDENFVKDFRDSLPRKRALNAESNWALMIFEFLKTNMDYHNAVICSSKVLEEYFDISRATVSTAIAALKKHEFISIAKSGSSNIYYIDNKIAWTSYANQKQYAKFSTNAIISKSEQEEQMNIVKEVKNNLKEFKQKVSISEVAQKPLQEVKPVNNTPVVKQEVKTPIKASEPVKQVKSSLIEKLNFISEQYLNMPESNREELRLKFRIMRDILMNLKNPTQQIILKKYVDELQSRII